MAGRAGAALVVSKRKGMIDHVTTDADETGVFSYSQILKLLKIEFERSRRYQYDLSLVLVEIDRLSQLGDMHGFTVCEKLEGAVAHLLDRQSRSCDFVGRMGERFVVLLPHTSSQGAQFLARRLHARVGELEVRLDERVVRISASVAVATQAGDDAIFFDSILKHAEKALHDLVQRGGDAVVVCG